MAEMAEIEVAWTWRSTSPLHVGSGLSRPGVADSLVQRDREGNAVIHGDAVKGALRMSAEQIVAWMGAPQEERYAEAGNAEPRLWPLARLFGGDAQARCTPARIVDSAEGKADAKARQVFAATAIDRGTGIARDKTLRKTEIVPRGLRLRASYTASVANDEVDTIETLLLAALASVDSIGGKAGIGWGRVDLDEVTVEVCGEERCQTEAVSAQRLRTLQCALRKTREGEAVTHSNVAAPGDSRGAERPDRPENDGADLVGAEGSVAAAWVASAPVFATGVASAPDATGPASCRWFKLTITLKEPTCLPGLPEISNKVTTHDWIAATTLRGALAACWRRSGRTDDEISSWLSEETRWTPGFRVAAEGDALVLPAPRSFITTKRAIGGARRLHDALSGTPPRRAADGTELQWRPAGDVAMQWDGQCAKLDEGGGLRETQMHVARNYLTRGKRSGALYARESLAPGTTFVAWARVPPSAFPNREQRQVETLTLLLGKRVSAGNGRATVCVESAAGPEYFTAAAVTESGSAGDAASVDADSGEGSPRSVGQEVAQDPEDVNDVFVHLLCPALVYDEKGYPLRTLDAGWWGRAFDAKLEASAGTTDADAYTGPGRRGGWMSGWKHPRAAVGTIEAGSIWRLRCTTNKDAEDLRAKLREEGCIGERVHEGFGWIVVDPPWLGKRPGDLPITTASEPASAANAVPAGSTPVDAPAPPQANGEPTSWPGVEMDAPTLAGLARGLAKEISEEAGPAFREIAARVRATAMEEEREFATCLDDLRKLCRVRAQRKADRWKPVENILGKQWCGYESLLFALDILAKRAAGKEE